MGESGQHSVEKGWFTPGHCEDIDGGQNHLPGQCPGAILNCSGACCG